jgi:hypothetical protein
MNFELVFFVQAHQECGREFKIQNSEFKILAFSASV